MGLCCKSCVKLSSNLVQSGNHMDVTLKEYLMQKCCFCFSYFQRYLFSSVIRI